MSKRALITGIAGQDGSYLAEYLLGLGYEVHGLVRRSSVDNLWRIRPFMDRLTLHRGDLADHGSVCAALAASQPDEVYNLADQDDDPWSFDTPAYNLDVTAGAVGRFLEAVRAANRPWVKVLQPVSAKVFGDAPHPQNEGTPFRPMSPYACAKACAYHLARMYRHVHGVWAATVILYNHDSPRRGPGYLLQTICQRALAVARGEADSLAVGDPEAVADVGFAGDYVRAMHAALQAERPDDYVVASGWARPVRQFALLALEAAGAKGAPVVADPAFGRPGPRQSLVGDARKARAALGWRPTTTHAELLGMILERLRKESP